MMVLLFALLLASVVVIWFGYRRVGMIIFILTLGIGFIWFLHHASDPLSLNL